MESIAVRHFMAYGKVGVRPGSLVSTIVDIRKAGNVCVEWDAFGKIKFQLTVFSKTPSNKNGFRRTKGKIL